ncbi:MAG TPA: phospholipid carrier-dependent glycosyltransferase [Herpetosiphonaceae bacterium]
MKRSLPIQSTLPVAPTRFRWLIQALLWSIGGLLLITLAYQVPARHTVQVGLNDAAYTQGFNEPANRWGVIDPSGATDAPFRWSRDQSFLLFPQIGLPATATIRWRALPSQGQSLPMVRVLLNGAQELGAFPATGDWETHTFTIGGGLLKANDLFLELRTEPASDVDGALRGVQVDQATLATSGWPVLPYPSQLVYGTAAIVFGTALARRRSRQLGVALAIALAFLLLYRLQLTPYPLRTLPPLLALTLGAIVVIRAVPLLGDQVRARLLTALALGGAAIWLGWLLLIARGHVTLSVPGVERDFPVFVTRAAALMCQPDETACVLRADGFYQLGYPLLLWLLQPLTSMNAFLAGRLLAALSGLLLLLATWLLGLTIAPREQRRGSALLALAIVALSPLVVQYALYVGTDMPFAAFWVVGLAALLAPRAHKPWHAALAGLICGLAFLIRHPGLVLLPVGWIALTVLHDTPAVAQRLLDRVPWRLCGWLTLGWLVAVAPQLVVNIADTGSPLYSQQAKNIWLAVYGNTDFSGRWDEAANDVALSQVVLADPPRFFGNWWRNLQAFVGTGAEDTREFGTAIGLRLLGFPANWLALLGLGIWIWRGDRRQRLLALGAALYVLGVCVGFVLPRFFLPLAPVWALAAVTPVLLLGNAIMRRLEGSRLSLSRAQVLAALSLIIVALLAGGPSIGARYVLDHQPSDAVAVVQTLLSRLQSSDRVLFALPADDPLVSTSALAHHRSPSDQPIAQYVVWSAQAGEQPSLAQGREPLATFGPYSIFALE